MIFPICKIPKNNKGHEDYTAIKCISCINGCKENNGLFRNIYYNGIRMINITAP